MKKNTVHLTIIVSLLLSAIVFSQTVPQTINYQGTLKDASGVVAANGDYELTFMLYDAESSGSELWTETKTITVTDGIVNTQLGSSTPIDLPFDKEYWLGIKIGTESELTPRIKLSSVPYSYMSMNVVDGSITADKIKSGEVVNSINSLTDDVTLVAGSNVSITPSGNNLTISSTATGGGLTLPFSGYASSEGPVFNVENLGNSGAIFANSLGTYGIWGISSSTSGIGVYGQARSTSGNIIGVKGETWSSIGYSGYFVGGRFYVAGNLGIGTDDPIRNLDILGYSHGTLRVKANLGSATIYVDRSSSSNRSALSFETAGTDNYWVGMLSGTNNLSISTSNTSLNGLQVSPSGDVNVSDNLFISGSIGLGITTTPAYKIDAAGGINLNKGIALGVALRCNGDEALWYNGTYFSWGYAASYNVFPKAVGINCAPGDGHMLAVNGVASKPGGGDWAAFSDIRLKDVSGDYNKGLNDIINLHPVIYTYKQGNAIDLPSDKEYIGLIAQEVEKVFPEAISVSTNGYLELDTQSIKIAMINAIKELKAENDNLKEKNNELLKRLEKIEKYLCQTAMK